LDKILDEDGEIKTRGNYFNYFMQFYSQLEAQKTLVDINNSIVSKVKQLIYKNVDNQSFKNPISM
jgi:hypothetical protein